MYRLLFLSSLVVFMLLACSSKPRETSVTYASDPAANDKLTYVWPDMPADTVTGDKQTVSVPAEDEPGDSLTTPSDDEPSSTSPLLLAAASPEGNVKTGDPYIIRGVTYYPLQALPQDYEEVGVASWYGKDFHGKKTANGEVFDMHAMTAAHKTLPLPTYVKVTSLENGREVVVRVNDRGPFSKGRVIDLSYAAAKELDMLGTGTARVRITVLSQSVTTLKTDDIVTENIDQGNFAVQLGAFSNKDNADKLAASFSNAVVKSSEIRGQLLYRVQVTGYQTQHEAKAAAEGFSSEYPGAFVIRN